MASQVTICKRALQKIGAGTITSLEDATREARACTRVFDTVRDATLRLHPWNFATRRAALAADVAVPAWGFLYQYPLPIDFLRLLEIKDGPLYQFESTGAQRVIVTDAGAPLLIKYTAQITDTAQFDALFVEALACKIAFELAEEITQSTAKKEIAAQDLKSALAAARNTDGQENPPADMGDTAWWDAREDGVSSNNTLSTL